MFQYFMNQNRTEKAFYKHHATKIRPRYNVINHLFEGDPFMKGRKTRQVSNDSVGNSL